jgi:hypothetical protein
MKTIFALCAAFMIGSLAGYGISNRYELVAATRDDGPRAYRIDKLTGQMWGFYGVNSHVSPIREK